MNAFRKAKKILIIEDDHSIRKFLSYRLVKQGYEVFEADNGRTGLEKARQDSPDLVILDLMLPQIRGEEVCKAIREDANKTFAQTPILMLTARASDIDQVIGKVIGANDYVTKPFDADELLEKIEKLISK